MASHPNEVTQLRLLKEFQPDGTEFYHPTHLEYMYKLNEVIKTVNYIINHMIDENDDRR